MRNIEERREGLIMNRFFLPGLLLIILFIPSCTTKKSTFLNNNNCNPPCWYGIELGETSREQTIKLLKGIDEVDKGSIQLNSGDGVYWDSGISWDFSDVSENSGEVYFHDDKAIFIHLYSGRGIPISEYIKELGQPKEARILKTIGDGVYVTADINFPKYGICLEPRYRTNFKNIDFVNIQSSTPIYGLNIYKPDLLPAQMRGICISPQDPNMIQQWKGYGDYEVYELK
jgi:hypothetical protein